MKGRVARRAGLSVAVLGWALAPRGAPAQEGHALLTNEEMVAGLAAALDLEDPRAVFRAVFARLEDEINVRPTENHYYFRFWVAGKEVWGSLELPARDRDDGVLSFGYRAHDAGARGDAETIGGGALFDARDGVMVGEVSDLVYDVEVEGRTVRFHLNPTRLAEAGDVPLAPGERYVGPVFDESGLDFHLLFDEQQSHLFLILDERNEMPERFRAGGRGLVFGERTAFAFWVEEEPSRRILVGVDGEHVLANDWLDGPFDQMPDNAIRAGRIPDYRRLVEASDPAARGVIDDYGHYTDQEGARVAVAPYLVYFDEDDVRTRIRTCRRAAASSHAFRACSTRPDFRLPPETTADGRSTQRREEARDRG